MPRYQYACTVPECGHEFEAVQSFSDDALTSCPACEGRLRKVFGAVGVVFKGSGFYRTDSRADSRNGSREERAGGTEKSGTDKSGADNAATGSGTTKSSDKGSDAKGSASTGSTSSKGSASTGSSSSQSGASGSTKAAAARSA